MSTCVYRKKRVISQIQPEAKTKNLSQNLPYSTLNIFNFISYSLYFQCLGISIYIKVKQSNSKDKHKLTQNNNSFNAIVKRY